MLLMVHSIPKYAAMTASLIEFLVLVMDGYDPGRRDAIYQSANLLPLRLLLRLLLRALSLNISRDLSFSLSLTLLTAGVHASLRIMRDKGVVPYVVFFLLLLFLAKDSRNLDAILLCP